MRKYCNKENTYIDIGAWIGPTVLYGACVSKHVYAIEPDPAAVSQLKKNSGKAFGIENPLFRRHMQDVRDMGFAQAHEIWGTYIYGQIGDLPRVRHLGE